MRKIYDEGGSLAEACCKRKYQQSNEVGEDDDDEEGFFRYLENLFFLFLSFSLLIRILVDNTATNKNYNLVNTLNCRDPSEMYAEAMGFGAGACVAGCCGGGQGFDPFAQFRSK